MEPEAFQMRATFLLHRGQVREAQEDAIGFMGMISQDEQGTPIELVSLAPGSSLVVSDGLGGHVGGATASGLVAQSLSKPLPVEADLAEEILETHREVSRQGKAAGTPGMGATLAMVVMAADGILIANVGDSPIFEVTSGLLQLSESDSPPGDRTGTVTQALGVGIEIRPHLRQLPLEAGVSFLLCSDGLTAVLDESRIADLMGRGGSSSGILEGLLDAALAAGGPDNIALAIVSIEAAGTFDDAPVSTGGRSSGTEG